MTRHRIDALEPRHEVYVGWDRPMLTYFGQVYDPARDEDETLIFWTGADRLRQHPEVSGLVRAMATYAAITPAMGRILYDDKELGR